jgi:hypothetical protein
VPFVFLSVFPSVFLFSVLIAARNNGKANSFLRLQIGINLTEGRLMLTNFCWLGRPDDVAGVVKGWEFKEILFY